MKSQSGIEANNGGFNKGDLGIEYTPKFDETLRLLRDCTQHKHIDRAMHFSKFYTWKILDSDLHPKLSEALVNYELLDRIQCEFLERYGFDTQYDVLNRNLLRPDQVLGNSHHMIDDEAESINFFDHVIMEGDEYREYADHPWNVIWKMWNRKYPDVTCGQAAQAALRSIENGKYVAYIKEKCAAVYGVPHCYGVFMPQPPFERFNKYYRGIKNGHMDLRRYKADMKYCFDRIMTDEIVPTLQRCASVDTSMYMNDYNVTILSHAMLNRKQWEEFYWPYMKAELDAVMAQGKNAQIFIEDSIIRFADCFQDLPKGFLTLMPEVDDVIELRKYLPNACIVGGMRASMLGYGTPQECVNEAERLIKEMGDGFILGQDLMMTFRNDAKRENLLAVCDYVHNFRW